jgi:hypothetical protein
MLKPRKPYIEGVEAGSLGDMIVLQIKGAEV